MKKYAVEILPRAEEDIERNARWWADHHDVSQATDWFYTVREQILALEQFPESHGLSAENDEFPYEIRDKLIGLGSLRSYRAVFAIRKETVFVLAVLRGAQGGLGPDEVDV